MDSFWYGRRVLVTGADGFVGSWLVKALLDAGGVVIALMRNWKPHGGLHLHNTATQVICIYGEVTNAPLMNRILNEYEIDTCFHLAAQSLVSVANRNPTSTFESNIRGTWTLLEQCRIVGNVKRIIVSTSDKVYGNQKCPRLKEDSLLLGLFPYDASKVCVDIISRAYMSYYGLPIGVARFANIYGGGDTNLSRIIPYAMKCVLTNQPIILRSDGTSKRDYVFIEDAVSAYLKLASNLCREEIGEPVFNFGTGEGVEVYELVDQIRKLGKREDLAITRSQVTEDGEIHEQSLDSQKAFSLLGWQPRINLKSGLQKTLDWYRDHYEVIAAL